MNDQNKATSEQQERLQRIGAYVDNEVDPTALPQLELQINSSPEDLQLVAELEMQKKNLQRLALNDLLQRRRKGGRRTIVLVLLVGLVAMLVFTIGFFSGWYGATRNLAPERTQVTSP